jgi:hypothetical protein
MILQLTMGGALVAFNVTFHAVMLDFVIRYFPTVSKWLARYVAYGHKPLMSALSVMLVFCSHIVQIWVWALVYFFWAGISMPDFHTALYFSTTTMTTLGYGDIVLAASGNILSSIEAANGLIAFGWSTAFTFEIISQLYRSEAKFIH